MIWPNITIDVHIKFEESCSKLVISVTEYLVEVVD